MNRSRRKFLKQVYKTAYLTIGGTALSYMTPFGGLQMPQALAGTQKRLILVFCRGGFDTLAMFRPRDISILKTLRPATDVMITKTSKTVDPGLSYLPHIGLKKVFFDSNDNIYTDVAVVVHTGSLNTTRSHFQAQDIIESGSSLTKTSQGFLARLAKTIARPSLAIGSNIPFSLTGCDPTLLQSSNILKGNWNYKSKDELSTVKSQTGLVERLKMFSGIGLNDTDKKLRDLSSVSSAEADTVKKAYDDVVANQTNRDESKLETSFSKQVLLASMMCRSTFDPMITTLDMGSWDTHSSEGINDGYFHSMATDLGQNLAALRADLIKAGTWNDTVVAVISEFGRTAVSNVAGGTDHGRGSAMILMGGNVNRNHSKKGQPFDLTSFDGTEGSRALKIKTDWRDVIAEVIQKHLGLSTAGIFDPSDTKYTVQTSNFLKVIRGW